MLYEVITPEASGRLSGSYESNGSIYRTEGKVSIHNPNYNLTLLGSLSQGKDYLDGNGDHVLANFKRSSLGAILGVKLSAHQDVKMSAINNMASGVDFPSLPMDLTSDDTWLYSGEHQIRFVGSALNQWNSSLYLTAVNHSMDNFHKPPPQMASAQTLADTYNYGGRTVITSYSIHYTKLYDLPIFDAISLYGKEKARLRKNGIMISDFDLLIGCTAIEKELIMVTENVREFERMSNIKIENWILRNK